MTEENLNFKTHIDKTFKKAAKSCSMAQHIYTAQDIQNVF